MTDAVVDRLNAALEGRYTVERKLGEGGMASVYLAHDVKHDRHVALKVLRPELAAVVGAERFLGEIRTTANLQHPNILPLFDSGEADGQLFYVMPYVEGESLRERLERERQLPVDEAVRIVSEVAEALQEAHEQGIVHRDVKPANVLLRKGKPLVADFGIALALSAAGGGRLTETGLSLGTPYYMSPEQASGDQQLTAATDIYSLGCMLYEMLTGDPPFPGSTAQAVLAKILTGEPAGVTTQRKAVPPNVDAAVLKSIEKVPADRFASATDFVRALNDPAFRYGVAAATAQGADARPWKLATMGIGALAAALAIALFSTTGTDGSTAPRFIPIALPAPLDSVTHQISPDGTRILYSIDRGFDGEQSEIWIREVGELEPRQVMTGSSWGLRFAPDGQRLIARRSDRWDIVHLDGRAPLAVDDSFMTTSDFGWGDQGHFYRLADSRHIVRVSEAGGALDTVATWEERRFFSINDVLPNERGLLGAESNTNADENELVVVDLETGELRDLVLARAGLYAASGHLVYVTSEGLLMAAPFDLESLELTGPAREILRGLAVGVFGADMSLSETGTLLYTTGTALPADDARVVWRDPAGGVDTLPTAGISASFDRIGEFELSPNGRLLAFTAVNSDSYELYVRDLEGGTQRQLADSARAVAWVDERTLVFSRAGEFFTRPADGSREASPFLTGGGGVRLRHLSFAGADRVVYTTFDTLAGLVSQRLGEERVDTLLRARAAFPAISPDGRWLAYEASETGARGVFVRPFPEVSGSLTQVSLGNIGMEPRWSPSGDAIYYIDTDDEGMMLTRAAVDTSDGFEVVERTPLVRMSEVISFSAGHQYDVALDESRFVMATHEGFIPERDGIMMVENFFELLRQRFEEGN